MVERRGPVERGNWRQKDMKTIDSEQGYEIVIGHGLLEQFARLLPQGFEKNKVYIITDDHVEQLYLAKLEQALAERGIPFHGFVVPHGDESKSIENFHRILLDLSQKDYTRTDFIIALGGGVVGDLAGFVASAYLRGIPFIGVPTTLLAQVDSSIGGKVGVNLQTGKNLAGAFYNPCKVVMDLDTLQTLKEEEFFNGMAEVIKYGLIRDKVFLERLARQDAKEYLADVVSACVGYKLYYVQQDAKDKGLRMQLNFGHTLGHAIETYYGFQKYGHGQAVAMGMEFAARLSLHKDMLTWEEMEKVIEVLQKYQLYDTSQQQQYVTFCHFMSKDKKNLYGKLNLILLDGLGKGTIAQMSLEQVAAFAGEVYGS